MNPSGPATPLHPDVPVVLDRTYFSSNVAGRRSGSTYHLGFGVNGQAQTTCKRAGWPEFGCPCLALRSLFFLGGGGQGGGGGGSQARLSIGAAAGIAHRRCVASPAPPSHGPGEGAIGAAGWHLHSWQMRRIHFRRQSGLLWPLAAAHSSYHFAIPRP